VTSIEYSFEILSPQEFIQKCKPCKIPTRPKHKITIDNIDRDLIESIKHIGILTPIVTDRKYYIIDGVKRYVIIKTLYEKGEKIPDKIPILRILTEDCEEKPISILHLAYIINKFRAAPIEEEFSDELITYIQDIAYKVWEIYNKDYEKAAKHLGFSVDTLRRLIEEYIKSMM